MLDYIKGMLVSGSETEAVIEAQGLGYRLLIGQRTFQNLPEIHTEARLFVSVVIREDSHRHFAFLTRDERDFFEVLIDLSGVGPKTALSILGQFHPSELIDAAMCSDVNKISKVPGVGKKTAERLVVELKGKNLKFAAPLSPAMAKNSQAKDALSALLQLGFAYPQAQKAIGSVLEEHGDTLTLSEIVTASLQKVRN